MRKLNLIVVFNKDLNKGLFCIRSKNPYKGKYNFVGGKVEENEKPMYDKAPSISNADKFAAATKQYKEFLDQRTFAKESFVNIADLREDLQGYINIVKDRLKYSYDNR